MCSQNRFPIKVLFLDHDLTFWLCLAVPGLIFGLMTIKLETAIIALATSLLGSFAFSTGFQYEVLARIDHRFRPTPHLSQYEDGSYYHSPFVYGPIIGSLVLALIGIAVQLRTKSNRKESGTEEEQGGLLGNSSNYTGNTQRDWKYSTKSSMFGTGAAEY